uniref:Uncharacterized protein n=1 Tax=Trichogramma kaykai TaxID=54128 RepID=A0ABD2WF21_9HYME
MHQEHTFHPDLVNDVQMEGISCIVSQFYSSTLESRTALIKTIKEVEEHSFVIISLKTSAFWCKRFQRERSPGVMQAQDRRASCRRKVVAPIVVVQTKDRRSDRRRLFVVRHRNKRSSFI